MANARPRRLAGHQFGKIGVDGDQFDAHADAGDEAPQVEAKCMVLERHDDAGDGVPEQRVSEDGAAAETVRHETDERGSDEEPGKHGGDEPGDAGGAERPACRVECRTAPVRARCSRRRRYRRTRKSRRARSAQRADQTLCAVTITASRGYIEPDDVECKRDLDSLHFRCRWPSAASASALDLSAKRKSRGRCSLP